MYPAAVARMVGAVGEVLGADMSKILSGQRLSDRGHVDAGRVDAGRVDGVSVTVLGPGAE